MSNQSPKEDVGKLIAENRPQLKSFISKRVSNKEDAEDILQDVFYQFVKAVENTLNPIEQVTAWLYRVAKNTIINKWKKKHEDTLPDADYGNDGVIEDFSEVLFSKDKDSSNPEMEYMRSLVWQELEIALKELPSEQKEAFELMELEGLPAKEISETLGISVNTLLSRKHYAVKYLRKRLADLYNEILYY